MAVPSASESGTSRRGFFTSPAVKVMLFQASAEKSEPTCATPYATSKPNSRSRRQRGNPACAGNPPRARWSARLGRPRRCAKLAWMAAALRPRKMPTITSPISASVFAEVKIFWMYLPSCSPRVFAAVRNDDQQNGEQLLPGEAQRVLVGDADRRDDPGRRRNRWHQHAEKSREGHRHRGDRARLDHQEKRPAVEKAPKRRVGFAQVDVLPAGRGHHRGQFAVGKRRADGQHPGNRPRRPAGRPPSPSAARYPPRR